MTLEEENAMLRKFIKQLYLAHTNKHWAAIYEEIKQLNIIPLGTIPKIKQKKK